MRLSEKQKKAICQAARHRFGDDAQLFLFGSRVDDEKRGGDIDLYVETALQDPADMVDAKLYFLVDLRLALGEQKVDVVLNSGHTATMPIHRVAKETGIRLL